MDTSKLTFILKDVSEQTGFGTVDSKGQLRSWTKPRCAEATPRSGQVGRAGGAAGGASDRTGENLPLHFSRASTNVPVGNIIAVKTTMMWSSFYTDLSFSQKVVASVIWFDLILKSPEWVETLISALQMGKLKLRGIMDLRKTVLLLRLLEHPFGPSTSRVSPVLPSGGLIWDSGLENHQLNLQPQHPLPSRHQNIR